MPNHVQHLLKIDVSRDFNSDEIVNKNIPIVDPTPVARASAVMLALGHADEVKPILKETDYEKAAERVDELWSSLGYGSSDKKSDVVRAIESLRDAEVFYESISSMCKQSSLPSDKWAEGVYASLVEKPFSERVAEVDWEHHWHYMPEPIGVLVNGYNATYNRVAEQSGLTEINYPSGYDWCVHVLGTKWGIYDLAFLGDALAFNTAWSPLGDEAMLRFIRHLERTFKGVKVTEHHFAEAGACYCGSGYIKRNDKGEVIGYHIESCDMDIWFIFDENEMKEAREAGYEIPKELEEFEIATPSGTRPPVAVEELLYYGVGLGG